MPEADTGPPGEETGSDDLAAGRLQRRWRWLRQTILQGTVISLLLAVVLTVVTVRVDDRRAEQDRVRAREESWRSQLVAGAEFPRALIEDLNLYGLYAPGVALVAANLRGTSFDEANLVGARLDGVDATGATFVSAQMDGAALVGAVLTDTNFEGASLRGADLRGSTMDGASLRRTGLFRADVRGVDLSGANLENTDLRRVCFDDETIWPEGVQPAQPVCAIDQREPEGLPGAHYQIEAFALQPRSESDDVQGYANELEILDGEAVFLVEFRNIGVAPLREISFVAEIPEGLDVTTVRLYDGNYPNGHEFGPDAIQANGRQVNINLGNYNASTNAFIDVVVDVNPNACGRLSVAAYVTPDRLGAITDEATIIVPCP